MTETHILCDECGEYPCTCPVVQDLILHDSSKDEVLLAQDETSLSKAGLHVVDQQDFKREHNYSKEDKADGERKDDRQGNQ